MSKNRKRILASALAIAFVVWAAPAPHTSAAELPEGWLQDWKQAVMTAKLSGKPILAVFSAQWCPPCQMMVKEVYPKPAVIEALNAYVHVYVDVDKDRATAERFMPEGFPTFILLDSNATEEDRFSGGMGEKAFLKRLQDHPKYMALIAKLKPQLANPPDTAEFWKEVGDLYMMKRKFDMAYDAYKKSLAKDPSDKFGIGDFVYFQENLPRVPEDLEPSEKALSAFESKYPKSAYIPDVTYFLGLISIDRGRKDEAITRLQAWLARFPGHELEVRAQAILEQLLADRARQTSTPPSEGGVAPKQ